MIQSPPRAMYCGRCGAPLAPAAGFCGRCGTPVAYPQAPTAQQPAYAYLQAPLAPPPTYAYPQAPRAAYPAARPFKLSPTLIVGGFLVFLIVIGVVVTAIGVAQFVGGSHATCTSNCAPKFVTPYPEEASYKSSAYHFQVNYSSSWTVRSQNASGITLGTKSGSVQIVGMSSGNPAQVLQSTVSSLPSSQFQDVTLVTNLKGAHIGSQDGVGAVYSANFLGASQTATKIRFAIIVASQRSVTVVVFAVDPADPKNYPNGMVDGQAFDYLCTEFVWG